MGRWEEVEQSDSSEYSRRGCDAECVDGTNNSKTIDQHIIIIIQLACKTTKKTCPSHQRRVLCFFRTPSSADHERQHDKGAMPPDRDVDAVKQSRKINATRARQKKKSL